MIDRPVLRDERAPQWHSALPGATALVVVAASALVSGRSGLLDRDQSIYVYGGQRLVDGVPPYVSVFDPKGPLSFVVTGAGIALARLVGLGDVTGARLAFAVVALAAAGAVLLVTREVWPGPWPAAAAAATFAEYGTWRVETLAGPDPKQLVVLCWMLAVWALLRRRWWVAGVAGALAAATWQPIALTVVVVLVAGVLRSTRPERVRAGLGVVAGVAVVVAALAVWLGAAGALSETLDATVAYPLHGIQHAATTPGARLRLLGHVLVDQYGVGAVLVVAGPLALLVSAVRRLLDPGADAGAGAGSRSWRGRLADPVVSLLLPCLVVPAAYSLVDFQGAPDLFPLLPAASFGAAAAVAGALALTRRAVTVGVGAIAAAVMVAALLQAAAYSPDSTLATQRAAACALRGLLTAADGEVGATPDGLWVLGDAAPLVTTRTVNADRFVYDGSGQFQWRLRGTTVPVPVWEAQVAAAHPAVVVISDLTGPVPDDFRAHFGALGYLPRKAGRWTLLIRPGLLSGYEGRPGCAPLRRVGR